MGKTLEYSGSTLGKDLFVGKGKPTRRAYGFDEIALVPGSETLDPELCDITTTLGGHKLEVPILASAMDGVVDVKVAGIFGKLGGLAVLNLQGVQTRYANTEDAYNEITSCDGSPISLTFKICPLSNGASDALRWSCRAMNSRMFPAASLKYNDDAFHVLLWNWSLPLSSFKSGLFDEIHA